MNEKQFLKQFGVNIAEARNKKQLTQEQLAELVGLHRTYIGFIEQGKRNPSIANIHKIAAALDINIKDLLNNL